MTQDPAGTKCTMHLPVEEESSSVGQYSLDPPAKDNPSSAGPYSLYLPAKEEHWAGTAYAGPPSHPDTKDHCTPHRSNNFNRNPSSFRPFTQFHIRPIDPKTCPILTYTSYLLLSAASYSLLFATFTRCSWQLLDMPLDAALDFSVIAALGRLILAALGSILLAALGSILLAALCSVYSLLPETARHAAR
ncbi:hypothetical protein PCANC_00756 [Puccinia coronata f. sp. avenae]|uniref:Uncharacterized protein n=1 Tax=Puccinia coronata f. sp. avenae TaxID=200324 RepID=A0A2N5W745_9BASI|nr:hypothetical protein PCANC_00756 [Puccinia coronata f. sp. avenae]